MSSIHASESFGPVILSLGILVVTPALALLVPNELVTTLTATPLRRAVSATLLLVLVAGLILWFVSHASIRTATAVKGGDD